MASRLADRIRSQRGFTLIELLVVILVIGILAAIALPMFLGQTKKADDADAKSNARNLAIQVDACFTPNEDFRDCTTAADLDSTSGLDWGSGPGQVEVTDAQKNSYVVVATSKTQTGGAYHTFTISHSTSGVNDRTCTAGPTNDDGGCKNGVW